MTDRLRALMAACGRKLRPSRRGLFLVLPAIVLLALVAHPAFAQAPAGSGGNTILNQIGHFIGNIALIVTKFLGSLLLLATDSLLIPISSYNGFVSAGAVTKGWVIVRDLTNMFFVLMMLVISIGTILGVEEFSYRRLLPRLLIMAILINFSKVIVGIFIDLAQVVMLTFVNGYSAAAGGNILQLFKLKEMMTDSEKIPENTALDITDYVGAQLLALLMMAIALFIVLIMCMMLAFRIVMLWMLTILSPIAFFLSTFPRGKAHSAYARWWELFGNYVVSGPLLAFFLWLAFSVTASGDIGREVSSGPSVTEAPNQYFFTEAGGTDIFSSYIVGVALLLAGMYITADLGVAAGGMLRGGADWLKGSAQRLAKGAALLPLRAGIGAAKVAGRGAGAVAGRAGKYGESQLFAKTGFMVPFSDRAKKRRETLREADYASRERAGMLKREAHGGQLRGIFGYGKGRKSVDRLSQQAAEARARVSEREGQKEALLQPANELESRAKGYRAAAQGNEVEMTSEMREFFTRQKETFERNMNQALSQVNAATSPQAKQAAQNMADLYMKQAADMENAVNVGDGEKLNWGSNEGLTAARAGLNNEAAGLERQASTMRGDPRVRAIDAEIAGMMPDVNKAERSAMMARQKRYGDPESRWLMSSVGKAESEAKEKLPSNMTPQDRMDFLGRAFETRDKFMAKVIMKKMAEEGELDDALTDKSMPLGGKYGNDSASVAKLADALQRRFGMTGQESSRTLNDVFQTASGKGSSIFHGKFAQDAKSGALRITSDTANSQVQAKKLDKMSVAEIFNKDSLDALFDIRVDGAGNTSRPISDAGLFKVAASQEKIMKELANSKVHPKVLSALKDSQARLQTAFKKGLLSEEFMRALSSAVAKKTVSATETAKKWKGRV